ncbi:MAG: helix-turn-helix domain-containing protein [Anaerovibrio sp.]|uniref:helix-turn-helix domain-containing protein n=1 Tax=Anaerovibrio sp. TaxID=1872532 RepID=UPI0025FCE0EA|nr:helix-turn-helix transcriptional regulator [Anaerovibrio sp.]MCR5175476.1 helix-turn-helix domain-containing protein [Anaerovibrio sp.]
MESINLNWLRRARRQRHLTIDRVAELVGRDRTTLWRYESGSTPLTVDMLFRLLDIYQLSILDVLVKESGGDH